MGLDVTVLREDGLQWYAVLNFASWRASVASETLTGVTQSKIGDVYLFICIYVWTYVCHFVL